MGYLTIGEVAKTAGVKVETVRYYERQELIPPPPRRESGYRAYPEETVKRIRFIKRAQELGFSLKEIAELLSLRVGPGTACADVRKRAVAKIAEIERKMETLRRIKEVLAGLAAACEGRGPASECPILESLENKGDAHGES